MDIILHPIGIIHTSFTEKHTTPIQPSRSQAVGEIEIYPELVAGLQDIEGLSHLILLYVFHRSSGYSLTVRPFLDNQLHGLFATRYPYIPEFDVRTDVTTGWYAARHDQT